MTVDGPNSRNHTQEPAQRPRREAGPCGSCHRSRAQLNEESSRRFQSSDASSLLPRPMAPQASAMPTTSLKRDRTYSTIILRRYALECTRVPPTDMVHSKQASVVACGRLFVSAPQSMTEVPAGSRSHVDCVRLRAYLFGQSSASIGNTSQLIARIDRGGARHASR